MSDATDSEAEEVVRAGIDVVPEVESSLLVVAEVVVAAAVVVASSEVAVVVAAVVVSSADVVVSCASTPAVKTTAERSNERFSEDLILPSSCVLYRRGSMWMRSLECLVRSREKLS